jgi:hypothetical protein
MASKRRLRRKSCARKLRYKTIETAKTAARIMGARVKKRLWPYRCHFCQAYHVGKPNRKQLSAYSLKREGPVR